VVYAALSSWRPSAAIASLARGQTVPYELTAAACSFGHAGVSPGFWGTGTPGECVRYVYRDQLYAMGSGFFQYYPEEFYVDYTAFRLIYKSPDRFNFIECYHPYWRSDDRTWRGLNSPFMQMAQHKGTTITVNGAEIPIDSDFINGRAVMKSPSVKLIDRVLQLRTPEGQLEVDWRGKVPTFSNP
jgi:hypothetical protein